MKKIHIISKTHLDLGYTDYAENIEKLYRDKFIPEAIELAENLNTDKRRFIWTLGSWIIDNALKYSAPDNIAKLDEALKKGYIVPHGIPFTMHSELLDQDTFRYGLNIGKKLAEQYNLKITAAKMTDVPGHTKAIIPLLNEYGIKLLHIGVNEGSAMPKVPEAFVWKYEESEIMVIYEGSYGSLYKNEHIDDILCFAHSSDNLGPNSEKNLLALYDKLEKEYPDYEIAASTLSDYAESLYSVKDSLPVITSEIGDSWIHGAASDPYKAASLRELISLKNKWLSDGTLSRNSDEYDNFANNILILAEHTCGMDVKKYLSDIGIYLKKDFVSSRARDKVRLDYTTFEGFMEKLQTSLLRFTGEYNTGYYSVIEKSWQEQRNYIDRAMGKLSDAHKKEAEERLLVLMPICGFDTEGMKEIAPDTEITAGGYKVSFNEFGAIKSLVANDSELVLDNSRSLIDYCSYNSLDYDFWLNNYTRNINKTKPWVLGDFARPLLDIYDGKYPEGVFAYRLDGLYMKNNRYRSEILSTLVIDKELSDELGAPRKYEILYTFDKRQFNITAEVIWLDKDASRLTEGMFLHFNFNFDKDSLRYIKLGKPVNPYNVINNGNRNLSAVQSIEFKIKDTVYELVNCHSPLVALGKGKILRFDNIYEDAGTDGLSYNLHNNVWGTNFPLWYSDNAYFRFELKIKPV